MSAEQKLSRTELANWIGKVRDLYDDREYTDAKEMILADGKAIKEVARKIGEALLAEDPAGKDLLITEVLEILGKRADCTVCRDTGIMTTGSELDRCRFCKEGATTTGAVPTPIHLGWANVFDIHNFQRALSDEGGFRELFIGDSRPHGGFCEVFYIPATGDKP